MDLTDDCTSVTYFGLFPILVSRSGDRYMLHSLTDLLYSGFVALAAGLSVGIGGLSAGYAIGIVGDYVSKSTMSISKYSNMNVSSVFEDMLVKLVSL